MRAINWPDSFLSSFVALDVKATSYLATEPSAFDVLINHLEGTNLVIGPSHGTFRS